MKRTVGTWAAGICLALLASGCTPRRLSYAPPTLDLSYGFDEQAVYWPTNESFKRSTVFEGMTAKGYFYSSYKYSAEEHGGTHLDAPKHFSAGGASIDQIPLTQLAGEGIVIDVRRQAAADRDYQVQVADLLEWESQHGPIPEHAMVLLYTGFGSSYPDPVRYVGTARRGPEGVAELRFPGLHPKAAEWLVTERTINGVGLDTASIDYGRSTHFESHRILCGGGKVIFENVANLDKLPARGSFVVALPMKIVGGSGAPLRIGAWMPAS